MTVPRRPLPPWLVPCLIAAVALLPYVLTVTFDFVNYDDERFVTANPVVRAGLTWRGTAWAWGIIEHPGAHLDQPHPLTWLSHMTAVSFFGLWAGGHHLLNVLLHAGASAALYGLLRAIVRVTEDRRGDAIALLTAALFGLHPVQVGAVAWIAERKTLLCALFMWLAMRSYVAGSGTPRWPWIAWSAAALLSKPMAVVLAPLLLLLDCWPLGRLVTVGNLRARLLEKGLVILFSAGLCVWTIVVQHDVGALRSGSTIPLGARLGNAVVACALYLRMLVWPVNLAVFYPHPGWRPWPEIVGSALLLLAISFGCWRLRRKAPACLIGWLWFLVSLLPMIGIVQTGEQALADRYLYAACPGLFMAITAVVVMFTRRTAGVRPILPAAAAAAVLTLLALLSTRQSLVWRDSTTLWRHAIAAGYDGAIARNNLGLALLDAGKPAEAAEHLETAVAMKPDYAAAWLNLGNAAAAAGQQAMAVSAFEHCVQLNPSQHKAWNNLGLVLMATGQPLEAESAWRQAVQRNPHFADSRLNLANLLQVRGDLREAAGHVEAVLARDPRHAEAHNLMGVILARAGRPDAAARHFQTATQLAPNRADYRANLAQAVRDQQGR